MLELQVHWRTPEHFGWQSDGLGWQPVDDETSPIPYHANRIFDTVPSTKKVTVESTVASVELKMEYRKAD